MTKAEGKGIDGSTLKLLAVAIMVIDHAALAVFGEILLKSGITDVSRYELSYYRELLAAGGGVGAAYILFQLMRRGIGRLAFPVFCFLLVEGFQKTGNRKRYAGRLFLFALLSEIPYDLFFYKQPFYSRDQNVFFTLLLGFLLLLGLREAERRIRNWEMRILTDFFLTAAFSVFAVWLQCDYDAKGIIAIALLYLFRADKKEQILAGCVAFVWEITAPLAFIPIAFYNGKRGNSGKYIFYLFYPVHLLVLYLIRISFG